MTTPTIPSPATSPAHHAVTPEDDHELTIGSLCTGAGGLDLGVLAALGGSHNTSHTARVAWVADPDPHVRTILAARLPDVPNLGDITTIDWRQVEPVDVVTAGFPCQDISAAGKRAGIEKGTRSGLWTHVVAAVRVLRPILIVENVAALRWRNGGLHRVLGDLAEAGYDALWRSVRAADIGAPHRRDRVFLLAWPQARNGADPADSARRRPRTERSGHATGSRSAGQPAPHHPRHRLRPERCAVPAVAYPDSDQPERRRGSRPVAGAPSAPACAQDQRQEDQRQRDGNTCVDLTVGRGAIAADTNGVGREELHPSHPARRAVATRPNTTPSNPTSPTPRPRHGHGGPSSGPGFPATAVPTGAPPGDVRRGSQLVVADTDRARRELERDQRGQPPRRSLAAGPGAAAAHAPGERRDERLPAATRLEGGPDAAVHSGPPHSDAHDDAHEDTDEQDNSARRQVDWSVYEPAIRHWEAVLGRVTPHPTQPGRHGRPVLSPRFVEHAMGLPAGWISDIPIPRTAQLRALGNGVVPQQAAHAVRLLLADLHQLDPSEIEGRHGEHANKFNVVFDSECDGGFGGSCGNDRSGVAA